MPTPPIAITPDHPTGQLVIHTPSSSPAKTQCGIEIWPGTGTPQHHAGQYNRFDTHPNGSITAHATLTIASATFTITDLFTPTANTLTLDRTIRVTGSIPNAGFASTFALSLNSPATWDTVNLFAPGLLYGRPDILNPAGIGGTDSAKSNVQTILIREDRLPLPVIAVNYSGNHCAALLHLNPNGQTTTADSLDVDSSTPLIDPRFAFASIGIANQNSTPATPDANAASGLALLACYPGCEGQITYRGDTYPGGQLRLWRRRYHPIQDNFTHTYSLAAQFSDQPDFSALVRTTWRWAWDALSPQIAPQDLPAAEAAMIDTLASQIKTIEGSTGIALDTDTITAHVRDSYHLMGFTGRNTDAACLLLRAANRNHSSAPDLRQKATAILDHFTTLSMNPPQAEGFNTGKPMVFTYLNLPDILYLRSLAEGALSMLRAYRIEKAAGREHPLWLKWSQDFCRWLLTHQTPEGGFPRGYHARTGEVANPALFTSYAAIEVLLLLTRETGDPTFQNAALRCGHFTWSHGQSIGRFVGGTIDNPDVADKEAATISLSAYLALFEATQDQTWLTRAARAADFAETWIYAWNIPMPLDADEATLHWKPGATTVGLQLISTGHSLADHYMAFDVGSYRKLAAYTNDPHYAHVADILLHNTKAMLSLPNRMFDLARPGWQQEHWSLAPRRGIGMHRVWLPWVTVSHLQGMADDQDFAERKK